MNRPAARRWAVLILRTAGTLLAAGLVVYLLVKEWRDVSQALQKIPPGLFLLLFGLMILSRLAVVARWHVLLRAAGVPVTVGQSARITFAGLFANNFLPTTIGGDVVRLAGALMMGFSRAVSVASLVVDRLVGMTSMAMILPFGLPGLMTLHGAIPAASMTAAVTPQGGIVRGMWDKGVSLLQRLFQALALWKNHPRSLIFALGFSWIHMLCWIVLQSLLLAGLGQNISVGLVAGLWSVVYFVTQLPVSINGWGVQELTMTFLLTRVAGASTESSLVLALVLRVLQMLASLPGAFFVPGMMAPANLKDKGNGL